MAKRRRQFIVDRSFQIKYTLLIAIIGGIISAIFGAWMWDAARTSTELLALGGIAGGEMIQEQIRADQANLPLLYVGITLLMVAALGLLGVLITHRVAGPAFVMRRYLNSIAQGTYPTIRPLRKRDELKDFFDVFERAVTTLKNRDQTEAEALDEALEKLEASGSDAEVIDTIRRVRDRKRSSVNGSLNPDQSIGAGDTRETKAAG